MDSFTIVAVWLSSLAAGALLTIGIWTIVTGRAIYHPLQRTNWSVREARLLGVCSTIQGIAVAVFALYGGLTLGAHVIPLASVGSPWGLFINVAFWLVILGTFLVQAAIQLRHKDSRHSEAG